MRLTESSNSVKISCHTKFRYELIFKGLGIIVRVKGCSFSKNSNAVKVSQKNLRVLYWHDVRYPLQISKYHLSLSLMLKLYIATNQFSYAFKCDRYLATYIFYKPNLLYSLTIRIYRGVLRFLSNLKILIIFLNCLKCCQKIQQKSSFLTVYCKW